jgi:hypothetical protein
MKAQCKTCGKNCEGEYCFIHKPRKGFKAVVKEPIIRQISEMQEVFLHIWSKRKHVSEVSSDYLGREPLHIFFHHILPKEKYPHAKLDEENIILLTLDEHTNVENDMYKYEEVNKRRDYLKIKYERTH